MNNFDPGILSLYDKNAKIQIIRRSQQGDKTMNLSFAQYRELIISSLPLAKSRGDRSTFSNVTYKAEGQRVRIRAQRYSQLYRNTNPHTLLVGPDATGKWVIFEEVIEAQR